MDVPPPCPGTPLEGMPASASRVLSFVSRDGGRTAVCAMDGLTCRSKRLGWIPLLNRGSTRHDPLSTGWIEPDRSWLKKGGPTERISQGICGTNHVHHGKNHAHATSKCKGNPGHATWPTTDRDNNVGTSTRPTTSARETEEDPNRRAIPNHSNTTRRTNGLPKVPFMHAMPKKRTGANLVKENSFFCSRVGDTTVKRAT